MLGLIQRVTEASVSIAGDSCGAIGPGLLLLLGVEKDDTTAEADKLLKKVLAYRVFADAQGKMNLSLSEVRGGLLVVSQFTLAAATDKGLRPSFSSAKPPADAERLYHYFLAQARALHHEVNAGRFGADMQVSLINDGPVTFLLKA
ncbi:MAG: D-tyrosyl-tRNA(Tyr) deacylase [Pseudomonadales bacterium]|jgi:D-tyrosyl-tRNA(Tyr) deacylase|nr:D-tyrosyl-tRNA(Tyr) deacylase [Pseudomonadales bacterium]